MWKQSSSPLWKDDARRVPWICLESFCVRDMSFSLLMYAKSRPQKSHPSPSLAKGDGWSGAPQTYRRESCVVSKASGNNWTYLHAHQREAWHALEPLSRAEKNDASSDAYFHCPEPQKACELVLGFPRESMSSLRFNREYIQQTEASSLFRRQRFSVFNFQWRIAKHWNSGPHIRFESLTK